MDTTPMREGSSQDSGIAAESFETNHSYYESTPKDFCPSIKYTSLKRKISFSENTSIYKETNTTTDVCLFSPPASSTLNESLINNLERFNLVENEISLKGPPAKCIKHNYTSDVHSAPTTPQKQIYCSKERRSISVNYSSSKLLPRIVESPLNEKNDILYPTRKLVSAQKVQTPKKFKESISPVKKCLFREKINASVTQKLNQVIQNDVIMNIIFKHLSDGDLYRLFFVSKQFRTSILSDTSASRRYTLFLDQHKLNKENYQITPPSSPEKDDTPPSSPESRQFTKFVKVAKNIDSTQSLTKCKQCKSPAYVSDGITQCSNGNCGYIYCKFCGSSSKTGPESFRDECGKAVLLCQTKRELSDTTNILSSSDIQYSIFSSPNRSKFSATDSGFHSETDKKCPKVRKNLTKSFSSSCNNSRILSVLNKTTPSQVKQEKRLNIIPPCKVKQNIEIRTADWEPPSPPSPVKEETYGICSRKSKRNLKRLTR